MKKLLLKSVACGILFTILVAQVDHVLPRVFGTLHHADIRRDITDEGVLMGSSGWVSDSVQFTPATIAIKPGVKEILDMARDASHDKTLMEPWHFSGAYPSINAEFSGFPLRSFYWIKRPESPREGGISINFGKFPAVIGTKILWTGLFLNILLYSLLVFVISLWLRMRRGNRRAKDITA